MRSGNTARCAFMSCALGFIVAAHGAPPSNLIANGGFDDGAAAGMIRAWSLYSSDGEARAVVVNDPVRSGDGALVLSACGAAGRFGGAVQTVDVAAGQRYALEAHVRVSGTNVIHGTVYGQLVIEWKAEDGSEISRAWSDALDHAADLSSWRRVRLDNLVAPEGAVKAVCGIHLFDGPSSGRGAVAIDDVAMTALDDDQAAHATGVAGLKR